MQAMANTDNSAGVNLGLPCSSKTNAGTAATAKGFQISSQNKVLVFRSKVHLSLKQG